MKLARFKVQGKESYGVVSGDRVKAVRGLSDHFKKSGTFQQHGDDSPREAGIIHD